MRTYSFIKMSGAGNDFVIIDKNANPQLNLNNKMIQRICNRRTGIGADGLILVSYSPDYDFVMNYYNSDGSTGSLCGNGARCTLKYFGLNNITHPGKVRFLSNNLVYTGDISDINNVIFNLNSPGSLKLNMQLNIEGKLINAAFIDTGSPHVVINIDETEFKDLEHFPVISLGRSIRNSDLFAPGGANINFIKIDKDKVLIRTYERGVEDETLSCGTGSAASAVISSLKYGMKPPVRLLTRGGDILEVNFVSEGQNMKALSLKGPADVVFTGTFTEELIL